MARIERSPLGLHAAVSDLLREGEYRRALPRLSRLLLVLPSGHPAAAGVWATAALVYRELGRFDDARRAAARALELDPALDAARALLRSA